MVAGELLAAITSATPSAAPIPTLSCATSITTSSDTPLAAAWSAVSILPTPSAALSPTFAAASVITRSGTTTFSTSTFTYCAAAMFPNAIATSTCCATALSTSSQPASTCLASVAKSASYGPGPPAAQCDYEQAVRWRVAVSSFRMH